MDAVNLTLVGLGAVVLYALGALCMRNTHPYSGSRKEPFEKKKRRRTIGIVLVVAGALLTGILLLMLVLLIGNWT
jgi:hypothetical protein